MKEFKVYTHPNEDSRAVKVGFSWPALFLGIIWFMYHGLWKYCAFLVGAAIGSVLIVELVAQNGTVDAAMALNGLFNIAFFGLAIFIGVNGNAWVRAKLLRQGYEESGTVMAENPELAVLEYTADKGTDARGRKEVSLQAE